MSVDITNPMWKIIKAGAVEQSEIADCLQAS